MGRAIGGRVRQRTIVYTPLPSQERFHRSPARFKGFSGPVGSGKSQALCQEAIRLAYLNAGCTGLLGAPTYPMLREATQATLFEILESNRIPYEHHRAENVLVLTDTGSRVLFRPLDDFERLRGTNLAWFGLDELTYTAEEAWLRLEARLRDPHAKHLCGFAVWTPKGFDWVYRRFIAQRVEGYDVILAAPFENHHLLSRVPDYYERLKRSYDERFYEQEVLGKYLNIYEGQVYYGFDRKRNVCDTKVRGDMPLLWSLDFNVDPLCSVVAQREGDTLYVVDELVLRRATTGEACQELYYRWGHHPGGLVVYGDASASHRRTNGPTDLDLIREYFQARGYRRISYRFADCNPEVRSRVQLVNAMLRPTEGAPRLYIDSKCTELIADLEQVSYKPGTTIIDKDKDPRRTHLSDALGYLVWGECRPRPKAGERMERLTLF
ncbi:MAG: terminase family protein [Bryobacterales bacterium]|nr:terminase large subunit [Bryobacteraceae bacterium]MDW8356063.1 terminase family protein [Bryobacterales bacterium]